MDEFGQDQYSTERQAREGHAETVLRLGAYLDELWTVAGGRREVVLAIHRG